MSISQGDVVRVAVAQFYSHTDVEANLQLVVHYMTEAKQAGCQLLVTPENSNRVRTYESREECFELSEKLDGVFITGIQESAKELGIMVAVGVDLRSDESPDVYIAQILIDSDGSILNVHHKTVFWDYEYTLFTPGSKTLAVVDTRIGRIGQLMCADGIVPEVPRIHALNGAQILVNSLNSRGPDEMRVHEPLRAIENHIWHVAANTVGGPEDGYPWMGGSQIVSPDGEILACAGETDDGMVFADITPETSHPKILKNIGDLNNFRRPELYGDLQLPIDSVPAAAMYGPVDAEDGKKIVRLGVLQTSWYHSQKWTLARIPMQLEFAATQGAQICVFPELFAHKRHSARDNPASAAAIGAAALALVQEGAKKNQLWAVASLVEGNGNHYYSTAYLVNPQGSVHTRYRKAHLSAAEKDWATPGDEIVVADTPLGRFGLMIGDEVWLPEVARILSLRGAEAILHPVDWDRAEAAHQAATERTEENRTHLVSVARTDNPAEVGSQIVFADRFAPGQPIALMRYPSAAWTRPGFEEDLFVDLDLMDSHSKVQGYHLDPLATRQPHLYKAMAGLFVTGEFS
jgi:predicted amidohydrolase